MLPGTERSAKTARPGSGVARPAVVLEVADGIGNCDQPAKRMRWCFAHTLSQSCTATE